MENSVTYLGETYTDEEIISGSFSKHQSLSMSELSVDTMEITIRPHNPFVGQFQQNTPLVQYVDGSQVAIWYLQSIERLGANVYKLNGFSSLGRLTQVTHYGGIYDGTQTVADVVDEIMGDLPYEISPEFENISIYGWLPIANARDNLQQVLFAVNAALQTNTQGVLQIKNLPATAQATITQSDIFQSGASVKYDTPVTKVVVVEHQYFVGSGTKELFNGTATGNQLISFDEPMSNLQASGLTIVSSGANYAIVSGTGALTGTPYVHTMREIERAVTTTATVENIVRVDNATLVGITASSDVAHRLADYYACRNAINVAVAQAFIESGAVASVFDPYDMVMRSACIDSVQVNLSNTPKSTISALVGYTPWQTVPFADEHELLTGNGTWTVPDGVNHIIAILIGGGQGGREGNQGGAPTKIGVKNYSENYSPYIYRGEETTHEPTTDNAGAGGLPGKPGAGGNILRVELTVTPGQTMTYKCGAGGAGARYGSSSAGTMGEATLLGLFSSANGASNPNGFFDPTSSVTYGSTGASGLAGGKGCSYGDQAPQGVEFGGVLYTPGANLIGDPQHVSDSSTSYGTMHAYCFAAFGGGAAAGANGSPGEYCSIDAYAGSSFAYARSYPKSGGAGGDAQKPPKETVYGKGGTGGNGGGGRGDYNRARSYNAYDPTDNPRAPGTTTVSVAEPLPGGNGSDGGDGADGCVILYYRRPIS
jgi:hypothetical protein